MTQTTTMKKPSRATVLILCAVMSAAGVGAVIGGEVHRQIRQEAARDGGALLAAKPVAYTGKSY